MSVPQSNCHPAVLEIHGHGPNVSDLPVTVTGVAVAFDNSIVAGGDSDFNGVLYSLVASSSSQLLCIISNVKKTGFPH